MLRLTLVAVLACWPLAQAGAACERHPSNLLIGDSIADRMRGAAERDGYRVIARNGAQLAWAARQQVDCAGDLVLVIGTNDLRNLRSPEAARAYVASVREAVAGWSFRRAVWRTPSCFDAHRNPVLHRGGAFLTAELDRLPTAGLPTLVRGDAGPCPSLTTGDGVHPDPATASAWWSRTLTVVRSLPDAMRPPAAF